MKASKQRTPDYVFREKGLRILPSSVIYGANASGKSNIIMSLALMKEIVMQGSLEGSSPVLQHLELYPFIHCQEQSPMFFEIEFTNGGSHFLFSFEVMAERLKKGKRQIISEQLWIGNNKKIIQIYKRDKDRVIMKRDKKVLSLINYDVKLLNQFEEKINENLSPTKLFLSNAFKTVISSEIADKVIDFFSNKLLVVSDFTLKKMNLSLSGSDIPDKDSLLVNNIVDSFIKCSDFGPQQILFKPTKTDDEQHSAEMQLVSIYESGSRSVIVPAELMESRGTLKLIDFAVPFQDLFSKGGVMVLDEFDAAIHPELIKGFIVLFNDPYVNAKGAQLIFTSHNPIYLNNKIFRRDQIKFVEKDKDTYESIIYSLDKFGSTEVRNDENYLLNYFKGNYGALPYVDFSKFFTMDTGGNNNEL